MGWCLFILIKKINRYYFIFQIIFSRGTMLEVKQLGNHPILSSAAKMVPDIVKSSRAKNTSKKYENYFLKFVNWCKTFGFSFLPANESTLCVFFSDLIKLKTGNSCIPDKDIRVFHLCLQILSHPCYLTRGWIKITCI